MATEAPARQAGRPRPALLVLLGVLGVILLWQMFSGGTAPGPVTTRSDPRAATGKPVEQVTPADLDVRVESLAEAAVPLDEGGRNPFRFQPKAPPPPPPGPPASNVPSGPVKPVVPGPPPAPPGPPAIRTLIHFIGIVDTGKEKIAAFSDCRYTFSGREGEIMEGRFRLVKIQVESAIVEYVDGTGRTILPLNGQACVGK
ncbi:MAG: hypothetical protein WD227_18490 [Vicinamibacterales bacterium]